MNMVNSSRRSDEHDEHSVDKQIKTQINGRRMGPPAKHGGHQSNPPPTKKIYIYQKAAFFSSYFQGKFSSASAVYLPRHRRWSWRHFEHRRQDFVSPKSSSMQQGGELFSAYFPLTVFLGMYTTPDGFFISVLHTFSFFQAIKNIHIASSLMRSFTIISGLATNNTFWLAAIKFRLNRFDAVLSGLPDLVDKSRHFPSVLNKGPRAPPRRCAGLELSKSLKRAPHGSK